MHTNIEEIGDFCQGGFGWFGLGEGNGAEGNEHEKINSNDIVQTCSHHPLDVFGVREG